MPSRVIREGLLDSQRYWSCTIEARQLFLHLMLLADDFGCISLAPVFIRRRCFDDAPPSSKVEALLQQLFDADLLRIYEAETGKYGFIPRFGQRLRIMKSKCPIPPLNLLENDDDAVQKFNEIMPKVSRLPVNRQSHVGHLTAEEKRREEKRREEKAIPKTAPRDWWKTENGIVQKAADLGTQPLHGETYHALKQRLFLIIEDRKAKSK